MANLRNNTETRISEKNKEIDELFSDELDVYAQDYCLSHNFRFYLVRQTSDNTFDVLDSVDNSIESHTFAELVYFKYTKGIDICGVQALIIAKRNNYNGLNIYVYYAYDEVVVTAFVLGLDLLTSIKKSIAKQKLLGSDFKVKLCRMKSKTGAFLDSSYHFVLQRIVVDCDRVIIPSYINIVIFDITDKQNRPTYVDFLFIPNTITDVYVIITKNKVGVIQLQSGTSKHVYDKLLDFKMNGLLEVDKIIYQK